MKIAVIGYGGRGRLYTDILKCNKMAQIVAVCDCDKEKLTLAQKELGMDVHKLLHM